MAVPTATAERLGSDARIPPVSANLTVHAISPATRAPLGVDSSPATLHLTEVSASGTTVSVVHVVGAYVVDTPQNLGAAQPSRAESSLPATLGTEQCESAVHRERASQVRAERELGDGDPERTGTTTWTDLSTGTTCVVAGHAEWPGGPPSRAPDQAPGTGGGAGGSSFLCAADAAFTTLLLHGAAREQALQVLQQQQQK